MAPARMHQLFYYGLSGVFVVGSLLVAAYYVVVQRQEFAEVLPLLQGAFVLACLFWLIGMVMARRHRRAMLAIETHRQLDDDLGSKSVTHG